MMMTIEDQVDQCIRSIRDSDLEGQTYVEVYCKGCRAKSEGFYVKRLDDYIGLAAIKERLREFFKSHDGHKGYVLRADGEEWDLPIRDDQEIDSKNQMTDTLIVDSSNGEDASIETPGAESINLQEEVNPQAKDGLPDLVDEGWVKLHRRIINNPVFKDSETLHLFLYCLLRANYKQTKIFFNQQEMVLERGQFISGRKEISKETGITQGKVRKRLYLLKNVGMIAIIPTNKFSIITVCNYNYYQRGGSEGQPTKQPARNKDEMKSLGGSIRPANDQQTTTDKNIKNIGKKKTSFKTERHQAEVEYEDFTGAGQR